MLQRKKGQSQQDVNFEQSLQYFDLVICGYN